MKGSARYAIGGLVGVLLVLAAACGDDEGDGRVAATATATRAPTATPTGTATQVGTPLTPTATETQRGTPTATGTPPPTVTKTPEERVEVQGLLVLGGDVATGSGDAVGSVPAEWAEDPDVREYDRALSHADWRMGGDEPVHGVTDEEGRFTVDGLAPGQYSLEFARTLNGNVISGQVPFAVGGDGVTRVVAEVSRGLVRAVSEYVEGGVLFRHVFAPGGVQVMTAGGRLARIAAHGQVWDDADGDGVLEGGPCSEQVWECGSDGECGENRYCQCTASCPLCEDCGPPVCVPVGFPPPYRCGEDAACVRPQDRCVCVASCPDCNDCTRSVCVPACGPVDVTAIELVGPAQLVAGQHGSMSAAARLSDGTVIDVTYLVEWHSGDPNVATVDSWGDVTALAPGVTELTASLGERTSESWQLQVTERPALTRIHVQNVSCHYNDWPPRVGAPGVILPFPPENGDLLPVPWCRQVVRVGGTLRFAAVAEFGAGEYYEDVTDRAAWMVDPASVGAVQAGLFTGLVEGTALLTATLQGITSEPTQVRVVSEATVVELAVYPRDRAYPAVEGGPIRPGADAACWDCGWSLTVLIGDEVRFGATAQYDTGEWEDVTERVTWRSNAPAVATIGLGGAMTAVGAGEVQIDAVLGEAVSNPVGVRVVAEATLESISIDPEGMDRVLSSGAEIFFHATGYYDIGIRRDVTREAAWRSSDEAVATFTSPGVLVGRAAGIVEVWAEMDGLRSPSYSIEVYATTELDYCDPANVNRDVWADAFNRVVLESDCAWYAPSSLVALRYTVTETQPHGGVFDPCLDLYVYSGGRRVRTLREEGCGEPFLPVGAPEYDREVMKYQLRAFWDLKDDQGRPVVPGIYTVYGRFYLYYDPVVSIDVRVLARDETPAPVTRQPTPTPTPTILCTPPVCSADEVYHCPGRCSGGCGVVCATPTPTRARSEIDLSGDWTLAIPHLGVKCPARIEQEAQTVAIAVECVGVVTHLGGSFDWRGALRVSGAFPSAACPRAILEGTVGRDGNEIRGVLACEAEPVAFVVGEFLATRGAPSPTLVPTPTPTEIPPSTPGEFDLSGSWLASVAELGADCAVDIRQTGSKLDVSSLCLGFPAAMSGYIDASGEFSLNGSFPTLCGDVHVRGSASENGSRASGILSCNGMELRFEARRIAACASPPCAAEGCGGPSGATCDEGAFCERPPGVCDDSGVGQCVEQPAACMLALYAPVCGCDGVTYGNDCERRAAGVSLAHAGACENGTTCAGIAGLGCPDGKVCDMRDPSCAIVDLGGKCVPKPESCPRLWAPMCGCDGKTYANDCERLKSGGVLAHPGECKPDCRRPSGEWFRCTSDTDCVVVDGTGCCSCSMGGRQAAVNRNSIAEVERYRRLCCQGIACPAVMLCVDDLQAACEAGSCVLHTRDNERTALLGR